MKQFDELRKEKRTLVMEYQNLNLNTAEGNKRRKVIVERMHEIDRELQAIAKAMDTGANPRCTYGGYPGELNKK